VSTARARLHEHDPAVVKPSLGVYARGSSRRGGARAPVPDEAHVRPRGLSAVESTGEDAASRRHRFVLERFHTAREKSSSCARRFRNHVHGNPQRGDARCADPSLGLVASGLVLHPHRPARDDLSYLIPPHPCPPSRWRARRSSVAKAAPREPARRRRSGTPRGRAGRQGVAMQGGPRPRPRAFAAPAELGPAPRHGCGSARVRNARSPSSTAPRRSSSSVPIRIRPRIPMRTPINRRRRKSWAGGGEVGPYAGTSLGKPRRSAPDGPRARRCVRPRRSLFHHSSADGRPSSPGP
jgi:hypothetical protein